jgi:hypothetical protein
MDFLDSDARLTSRASASRAAAQQKQRRQAAISSKASLEQAKLREIQQRKAIVDAAVRSVNGVLQKQSAKLSVPGDSLGAVPLSAYPVHGDGDKVTLPVSVLESLQAVVLEQSNLPLVFRIAVAKAGVADLSGPDCVDLLKAAREETGASKPSGSDDSASSDDGSSDDDSDDEVGPTNRLNQFIVDHDVARKHVELAHAGVVEFSAPDGFVGLPRSIAKRLLSAPIPSHILPSPKSTDDEDAPWRCELCNTDNAIASEGSADDAVCKTCTAPRPSNVVTSTGKPAYGSFPTPSQPLTVSLVRVPKGTGCTIIPTVKSLTTGFLELEDVKLVLEQSLIRTRTTLSPNDTVTLWHRGKAFDLIVKGVTPAYAGVVCCVDTNIEVDIGENVEFTKMVTDAKSAAQSSSSSATTTSSSSSGSSAFGGTGHTLMSSPQPMDIVPPSPARKAPPVPPPNAPACRILIRYSGGSLQHAFVTATTSVADLYAWVGDLGNEYAIVSRFPRKVYDKADGLLKDVGFDESGSAALFVEMLN